MIYTMLLKFWGRVFGRASCRRLNNLLVNLGSRGLGVGDADHRTNGEAEFLARWLAASSGRRGGGVVVDVGANEGDYSALVLQMCPEMRVHALEPHPGTFARLRERLESRGVRCHNVALGSCEGTMDLWDYEKTPDGSSHATFYPRAVSSVESAPLRSRSVHVATLDRIARSEHIEGIRLLKLDTEGHELEVLRGAGDLLAANRIDAVQFEFNYMHLEARVNMMDFAEMLSSFELYRILPRGLVSLDFRDPMLANLYRMQNILAVRRGLALAP